MMSASSGSRVLPNLRTASALRRRPISACWAKRVSFIVIVVLHSVSDLVEVGLIGFLLGQGRLVCRLVPNLIECFGVEAPEGVRLDGLDFGLEQFPVPGDEGRGTRIPVLTGLGVVAGEEELGVVIGGRDLRQAQELPDVAPLALNLLDLHG